MASLFISYSRKDIDFARRLTEAFKGQDLDFWIDWEGIPPTVDWWKEIEKGIEEADIFLFLLSSDSAKSKVCKREIEHATRNGKRLIPVVVRDVKADEAPVELQPLNWIFLRENDDFYESFGRLMTAIKTDYEWVQTHRQLQVKALEWERSARENSFLLRGKELQDAEFQTVANSSKEPFPTDLQREFVSSSKDARVKQRRIASGISMVVVIIIAWLIYPPLTSWFSTKEMPDWEPIPTWEGNAPRSIAMNLKNPDEVYLSDLTPGTFYSSRDSGDQWHMIHIEDTEDSIIGLSAVETNLYALTDKTVWHSLDGGTNWSAADVPLSGGDAKLLSISVNPHNGNEIYVGANDGTVYHSSDNGKTWDILSQGYGGNSINFISTNGSVTILATEEGLWVNTIADNTWDEVLLPGCSNRSDQVSALALTYPYGALPLDDTFDFFAAIPGAGICQADTRNLFPSALIQISDHPSTNIASLVSTGEAELGYEGYVIADNKIHRKRFWFSNDFEWWKIKFKSLFAKGN